MLNAFRLTNGRLIQLKNVTLEELKHVDTLWVDLQDPTEEERELAEYVFQMDVPEDDDMEEIEESARFFEDESGLNLRTSFLSDLDEVVNDVSVSFTVKDGRLLTVRDETIPVFRLFRMRARAKAGLVKNAFDIVLGIFALGVEQDADVLEGIYRELDEVSRKVLKEEQSGTDAAMERLLAKIAEQEDVNGMVRLDLMDSRRGLSFLQRSRNLSEEQVAEVREILRDIESLNSHSSFLFDKINFLMDALLGLINLTQNRIIKIFSIAAVVFLPPTLVASSYGMNFANMPELGWQFGYPMALGMMIVAGILPYLYFKRKGWLD